MFPQSSQKMTCSSQLRLGEHSSKCETKGKLHCSGVSCFKSRPNSLLRFVSLADFHPKELSTNFWQQSTIVQNHNMQSLWNIVTSYLAILQMLQQATIHFGSVKKKIFLCTKSSLSNWGAHTQHWDLQKNRQNFVSWAVVSFQTIQQCVHITLPEIHISIYN
jgi:hypothetical protein